MVAQLGRDQSGEVIDASRSVAAVSEERWQVAQRYELETWRRRLSFPRYQLLAMAHRLGVRACPPDDDWNLWWRSKFEEYRMIPREVGSAIEVGCGPFTNIRLIRERCTIDEVVLNDPLVEAYAGMRRSWVSQVAGEPWLAIDPRPLESLVMTGREFDLVVMINVLDHVQDPEACMDRATGLVAEHGLIVIGQDLYEPLRGRDGPDPGHPVRIREGQLSGWVDRCFRSLYQRTLPRNKGRNPDVHGGTFLFVGQR